MNNYATKQGALREFRKMMLWALRTLIINYNGEFWLNELKHELELAFAEAKEEFENERQD